MGRDHSCPGCGNGGLNNNLPCTCGTEATEVDFINMINEFRAKYFEMKREAGRGAASSHCHEFAFAVGLLPSGERLGTGDENDDTEIHSWAIKSK